MKRIIHIILLLALITAPLQAQDTLSISVDSVIAPRLSEYHYLEKSAMDTRNYDYDIRSRARYYKSMGYAIAIAGPLLAVGSFFFVGYIVMDAVDLSDWAEFGIGIGIPLVGGAAVGVPLVLLGRSIIRKGQLIEQMSYIPLSDKVSLSTSQYANMNDRMDKGGTVGIAVRL